MQARSRRRAAPGLWRRRWPGLWRSPRGRSPGRAPPALPLLLRLRAAPRLLHRACAARAGRGRGSTGRAWGGASVGVVRWAWSAGAGDEWSRPAPGARLGLYHRAWGDARFTERWRGPLALPWPSRVSPHALVSPATPGQPHVQGAGVATPTTGRHGCPLVPQAVTVVRTQVFPFAMGCLRGASHGCLSFPALSPRDRARTSPCIPRPPPWQGAGTSSWVPGL